MIYLLLTVSVIIILYIKYRFKFDLIKSYNKYILIVWYDYKDNNGDINRTYKRIITI